MSMDEITPKYSQLRASPNRVNLARAAPLRAPLTIYIEPTNICNFRCVQCPLSFPDYKELAGYYQQMPFAMYGKVIEDMRVFGRIKSLKLYFEGEPLLHPKLGEMIRLARKADVAERIEVTSNASTMNRDKALDLITSGLHYLRVSVYATDEPRHRDVTQTKIPAARIRENVRQLRNLRDELNSKTPVIMAKFMHESTEADHRFVEQYTGIADETSIEYPFNWNGFLDRDLVSPLYKGSSLPIQIAPIGLAEKACPFPFYLLAVKSNGDVTPCCVDWNGATKIGNVMDRSLAELWRSEELFSFLTMHLEGRRCENDSCRNCPALNAGTPDSVDGLTSSEFRIKWHQHV